jgi:hypothetical protein
MAGVDAIRNSSVAHGGTDLAGGVDLVRSATRGKGKYDRLIVITDEQVDSHWQGAPDWKGVAENIYVINVASAKNGVGYGDGVVHVDGFSENVLRYIAAYEGLGVDEVDAEE